MESEKRCRTSDGSDTPEPPKLTKIGFDIWQGFWRQFKNYCDTKRGAMKIPISYVFRDHLVPTAEMMAQVYADSDEALMMKVTLTGPDYHFDNKTVWGILTRLVGDGSAWPFIKSLQTTYNALLDAIECLKAQFSVPPLFRVAWHAHFMCSNDEVWMARTESFHSMPTLRSYSLHSPN